MFVLQVVGVVGIVGLRDVLLWLECDCGMIMQSVVSVVGSIGVGVFEDEVRVGESVVSISCVDGL